MAILWSKVHGDVRYEVRSAGQTVRLYTNNAFHSEFSPVHLFTGGVWDLMTVATLFREPPAARILLLGVGGGSVVQQLLTLLPAVRITGVEIDPVHLTVARRWFDVKDKRATLICADARDYLAACREQFDVVIDDVFVHAAGDPERPFAADADWFRALRRALHRDGVLIQNHLGRKEALAALMKARTAGVRTNHARLFSTPRYENRILAMYPDALNPEARRLALKKLTPAKWHRRLKYRSSTLEPR